MVLLAVLYVLLPLLDVLCRAEESLRARLDCVRASEQCLREQACSSKYRTMRQCAAGGGKESNFSMQVAGLEARDECRSAVDALKQSPLYNCRCKRGMKKEKNCLRIYWGIYQTLQGNDFLEDSPYEPVNSRLSDIFRLAPIIEGGEPRSGSATSAPGRGGGSPSSTDLQDPSRNRRAHPNWAILGNDIELCACACERVCVCVCVKEMVHDRLSADYLRTRSYTYQIQVSTYKNRKTIRNINIKEWFKKTEGKQLWNFYESVHTFAQTAVR
uniref:GDNF/GAS1 domain-containing protein n=1 Tax=Scophthalmus maximus TaxID=52904 RepID=A0A8D3CF15_SCOMX